MYSSSLLGLFTAGLACFAPLAAAYTQPTSGPEGNPIYTPGLNEQVPAGKSYDITWNATSKGTVTLVLLRGPSSNAVALYPIAEKIANSGEYEWTPSTNLEPDTTHYGIQLIDDATGKYQYSTQFGISNPDFNNATSSTSSGSGSASASATTSASASTSSAADKKTSTFDLSYTKTIAVTAASASASGVSAHGSAVVSPTKPMTVPASLMTSSTASASVPVVTAPANSTVDAGSNTNGAGTRVASLAGVAIAAGMAILVL